MLWMAYYCNSAFCADTWFKDDGLVLREYPTAMN